MYPLKVHGLSRTRHTGFYPSVMHALCPDIIAQHVPAMPVSPIPDEPQIHREREPKEKPENDSFIFDSVDPLAAAARLGSDEEPADDEAEDHETRDDRLRREATSLEHLTLHDRQNHFVSFANVVGC